MTHDAAQREAQRRNAGLAATVKHRWFVRRRRRRRLDPREGGGAAARACPTRRRRPRPSRARRWPTTRGRRYWQQRRRTAGTSRCSSPRQPAPGASPVHSSSGATARCAWRPPSGSGTPTARRSVRRRGPPSRCPSSASVRSGCSTRAPTARPPLPPRACTTTGCCAATSGTLETTGELAATADPIEREVFETVSREPVALGRPDARPRARERHHADAERAADARRPAAGRAAGAARAAALDRPGRWSPRSASCGSSRASSTAAPSWCWPS